MDTGWIILLSFLYVGVLFVVAYYAERQFERGRSLVNNPVIYSLSLAVYCTAWTFYGSVGRAATDGMGFLPIYLGPVILAPLWWVLLKKIILISKSQRITSIADFISSRYGKSTWLGIIATLISVFGIIPYISIQLKAISASYYILGHGASRVESSAATPFFLDNSLYIAGALALFTIFFGTRHLDPNERHEGLVAAIAFESLVKLIAFLAVGIFVTFGIYEGFGDLFAVASSDEAIRRLLAFQEVGIDGGEWFWLIFLSMSAIIFLPRQFHVAVVENTNPQYVARASWLFPLYLLLINIFVLPIAVGGLIQFPEHAVEPDTFVLSLPLAYGKTALAMVAAIGGFSAATSMVIVAVIALSIMISNNLVLPFLLKPQILREEGYYNLTSRLLGIRRISIVVVLLLAYAYFKSVGENYPLVSIGLISFTAVAQFAPTVIGGIYWKRGTRSGAIAGLLIGFCIWAYTLPLPTLEQAGILPFSFVESGPFGIALLRPYHLFGLTGFDHISHAAFWSLFFNAIAYFGVSLGTRQRPLEISQADIFVNIYKYRSGGGDYEVLRRQAPMQEIKQLLDRFLGPNRTREILNSYEKNHGLDLGREAMAGPDLITFVETHLTGAIGAASAKVIIGSIAKEDPISLEEMFKILEQTQEIIQYSKALERKSGELERTTLELKVANERLKELDRLKADFITTVTHELRTPITSIKALSKILLTKAELPHQKREEFLSILVNESERISRLINQVLDLEKIQTVPVDDELEMLEFTTVVRNAYNGLKQLMEEKQIDHCLELPASGHFPVRGHYDRLTQVVVNLVSNAIKFANAESGRIEVRLVPQNGSVRLSIQDNGRGIAPADQHHIFEKFTQVNDRRAGKPKGSGLGLFITKTILEHHGGRIWVESEVNRGAKFVVELPLAEQGTTHSRQAVE